MKIGNLKFQNTCSKDMHTVLIRLECSSEKLNPPILSKLCILTHFDVLLTNMIVEINENSIFMVNAMKNPWKL